MPRTVVIGAGFAGLSAAAHLARAGHQVTVLEKNDQPGGRARTLEAEGFTYDMGPSWYWMPDVFERHFEQFGHRTEDLYELKRLNPSYSIYFGEGDRMKIPAGKEELYDLFESMEPGSTEQLKKFLSEAERKYAIGMQDLVRKPAVSITEFIDMRVLKGLFSMQLLTSLRDHVHQHVKHPKLRSLLEFPVLFLGATPRDTPALYSLMNHADLTLGTWYPTGGMRSVVNAMVQVAEEQGATIKYGEDVQRIEVAGDHASTVITTTDSYECDVVIGGADYHHVEQQLLPKESRTYTSKYWNERTMAPSVLMFYLGVDKRLKNMDHHTLFFDESLDQHAHDIYKDPKWPSKPLFYTSCTSITDPGVAPEGKENLVVLIPIAPGLDDPTETRDHYYELVMDRLEKLTDQHVRDLICYRKSYSATELREDMNAFRGNAYGLANTLKQTAILRPSIRSKKVKNLFYTGQLTVPGPGVPPAIISGEVVSKYIAKHLR